MPKIPRHQGTIGPPVVREQNVGIVGREISVTGTALQQIAERFDKAQRLTQYNDAMAKATQGFIGLTDKYKMDRDDPNTMTERATKDLGDFKTEITKDIPDPRVAETVARAFDVAGAHFMSDVRGFANAGIIDEGRAKFLKGLDVSKEAWVKSITSAQREYHETMMNHSIGAAEIAGFIDAEEATRTRLALKDALIVSDVQADIMDDPWDAVERLRAGEYDVDPEQRLSLVAVGTAEIRRREAIAAHDKATAETAIKKMREMAYTDFVKKLAKNEHLTIDQIINDPYLLGTQKEHFIKALADRAKAIEEGKIDPFAKGDPRVYGEALIRTTLDPTYGVEDVVKLMGKGLSAKDVEHFIGKIAARDKGEDDPVFKRMLEKFEVYKKNGLFGTDTKRETIDLYFDTISEFSRRVDVGELKGAEVEKLFDKMMEDAKNQMIGFWPFWEHKLGKKYKFAWEEWAAMEKAGALRNEAIEFLDKHKISTSPENIAKTMEHLKAKKRK